MARCAMMKAHIRLNVCSPVGFNAMRMYIGGTPPVSAPLRGGDSHQESFRSGIARDS